MRLSDSELLAAVDAAEAQALGAAQSTISSYRAEALNRYLGKPYGGNLAPKEGRSDVVSRDVADVIEGVLANVIKPFVGGEDIVSFSPMGPDDEERAKQETDYVNMVVLERNNGFLTLNSAMKDALLLRAGYVMMSWNTRQDVVLETYTGQSDEEMALLLNDKDVEVVQHTEYQMPMPQPTPVQAPYSYAGGGVPPLVSPEPPVMMVPCHDVKVRRVRPVEYVRTDPVPPEEVLVSSRARSPDLQEVDFVQHRPMKSISELREAGYKIPDDIEDGESADTAEDIARSRESFQGFWLDDTSDPARRLVRFKKTWIRIDRDGDGVAELRRVCQVGKTLLSDEEDDIIAMAAFVPLAMPHQHAGISVLDLAEDIARLKTGLTRAFMDNKYLSNNTRIGADVTKTNVDDLLESRPGGVIRTEGPPSESLMPLVMPDTGATALQGLEYLDSVREGRTGYTRQSQGLNTDALIANTATGMQLQLSQSQLRLEMYCRTLAETGVRAMMRIVHALTLKHSTRAEKVRLNNHWCEVNPREWVKRVDLTISNVGAVNQQMVLQGIMMMGQLQEKLIPTGMVTPDNLYNSAKRLAAALGFKNCEEFVTPLPPDPKTGKSSLPQPGPPPQVQVKQMELQADAQKTLAMNAHEKEMALMGSQIKQSQQQGELALQQSNDQRQALLDQRKHELDMAKLAGEQELARQEMQMKEETAVRLANINAAAQVEVARIKVGIDDGTQLLQQQERAAGYALIQQAVAALQAPKVVTRNPDGSYIVSRQGGDAQQTLQ